MTNYKTGQRNFCDIIKRSASDVIKLHVDEENIFVWTNVDIIETQYFDLILIQYKLHRICVSHH